MNSTGEIFVNQEQCETKKQTRRLYSNRSFSIKRIGRIYKLLLMKWNENIKKEIRIKNFCKENILVIFQSELFFNFCFGSLNGLFDA